jgi:ABC-2 type transport system ATP-binding protein
VAGGSLGARAEELLETVGLTDAADRQIRKYSKGMQQRLGIAQALAGDPAFVVLDEPMSGLDPIGRKDVRDLILELKRRGKTVFFSTHILPDVESICDRVGVILGGRLRDVGRISDLLSPRIRSVEVVLDAPEGAREGIAKGQLVSRDQARFAISFPDLELANAAVASVLAAGGALVSLVPYRETLEDFFLRRLEEGKAAGEAGRAPEVG